MPGHSATYCRVEAKKLVPPGCSVVSLVTRVAVVRQLQLPIHTIATFCVVDFRKITTTHRRNKCPGWFQLFVPLVIDFGAAGSSIDGKWQLQLRRPPVVAPSHAGYSSPAAGCSTASCRLQLVVVSSPSVGCNSSVAGCSIPYDGCSSPTVVCSTAPCV